MKLREPLQSVYCHPTIGISDLFVSLALVSTKCICFICTLKLFFYSLLQQLGLDLNMLLTDKLPTINKFLGHHFTASTTRMAEAINSTAACSILSRYLC